jgi:hypothetical protein
VSTTPTTSRRDGAPHSHKLARKAERIDEALRDALYLKEYGERVWSEKIARGATDDEIRHSLVDQFGSGTGSQTESGIQYAVKGLPLPQFWLDSSSAMTTAKATLSDTALVRRVRKLLAIPLPGATEASPEVASVDGKREFVEPTVTDSDAHEFTPRPKTKTICSVCARGRNAKPHKVWIAAQASAPSTIATPGDEVPESAPSLEAIETAQRHRFTDLELIEETLSTEPPKRRRKQLEKERSKLADDYDAAYTEVSERFGTDATLDMRARVETPYEPDDRGCGGPCEHTDEEHEAFDAGVLAGEQGYGGDGCPHEDAGLRHAWLTGHSVGVLNRSAAFAKSLDDTAATDDASGAEALNADSDDGGRATPATQIADAPDEKAVFTKEVEIELNDHDIAQRARAMSLLDFQIEELLVEKKKTDDTYKAKIGGLVEQRAEMSGEIRRGRATQELKVFEHRDYEQKIVELRRADTGVVVESRPMKPRELQPPLPSL